MKNFKIILAVSFLSLAVYFLSSSQREESSSDAPTVSNEALQALKEDSSPEQSQKKNINEKMSPDNQADAESQKTQEKLSLAALEEFDQISKEQKESLIVQASILKDFATRQTRSDALIEKLQDLEVEPLVMNDENPYTGSMKIVRSRSPMPGTRYFHAQYFDNEQNEEYVQHMSFEFRPGKQSFEAVKKSIELAFELKDPIEDKEGFISWRQGEDYIVWIKKMDKNDIQKDDPFNAYNKQDVGTIRVAKELEIHDQAPAFHMQQGEDQRP